ncbi:dihydrolipoamide acetyltransferase family protein [Candidatus Uabimicrobium amorphum]|uniref:Dihydrolipoamide acetyltransferase component of pyruvate dehydrogenase complex n=1 Tax=Uabimicrobium amorphum TaxID=2596890 RepID=A0A5S9IQG2_UABAM|nr:dihydrolipoamide acetyltransferase family protein [Candidatus Uabimicrobium amorphum]BBM85827.1 dihydrolipoamide acetyltransferase component of pyruvate dehydrogenase complex [Candidatus Uabimicrobium amorphum]
MSEYKFTMPSLGADMEVGQIVKWLVKPGDTVKRGDIVAVVETAKGNIEIEVWHSGTVAQIVVETFVEVPVGTVLAVIDSEEKMIGEVKSTSSVPTSQKPPRLRASPSARKIARELRVDLHKVTGSGPHGIIHRKDVEKFVTIAQKPSKRVKASPAARKLAKEMNVDLASISPKGKVIQRQDVLEALAQHKKKSKKSDVKEQQKAMRKAIAAAMSRSKKEIPHYYLGHRINMHEALSWLERENSNRPLPSRLIYAVLLVKATALALRKIPELNGFYKNGEFVPSEQINVGMAISLRTGGLIAPALFDVDKKNLEQLMTEFRDLVKRARRNKLKGAEMTQPTVTLTNLGEKGVETVFGVIYPPQVALVGFGSVTQHVCAVNNGLCSQPFIHASLAADHRVSDGHRGGLFLRELDRLLQNPQQLC